ncbi:hypothetical protein KBC77_03700 [Candidatus Saccharibacteria bacterium]|nr:hypothetical protein [Candidatus Saccharibacteria bacterium]
MSKDFGFSRSVIKGVIEEGSSKTVLIGKTNQELPFGEASISMRDIFLLHSAQPLGDIALNHSDKHF